MGAFETFRTALVAALSTATAGLGDYLVRGVRGLPSLSEPGAVATWLYALSGLDRTGGLLLEAKLAMDSPSLSPERRAAWRKAYELMLGLREVLRELPAEEPAKESCEACESFGCSLCDQSGMTFTDARAA
jgi:hypothetical protein